MAASHWGEMLPLTNSGLTTTEHEALTVRRSTKRKMARQRLSSPSFFCEVRIYDRVEGSSTWYSETEKNRSGGDGTKEERGRKNSKIVNFLR